MARILVGCCGFPVGREKYYKTFKGVEIQQTFYQLPVIEKSTSYKIILTVPCGCSASRSRTALRDLIFRAPFTRFSVYS